MGRLSAATKKPVWIRRIDVDHRDHLAVAKAEVRPRLAAIGGFVHPVADGEVRANDPAPLPT
jgi:hypothetical protein